jgi:hypothetical protein
MGFPQRSAEDPASSVFVGESPELLPGGYTCPRCKARTAELPCRCATRALLQTPQSGGRDERGVMPCSCCLLRGQGIETCCHKMGALMAKSCGDTPHIPIVCADLSAYCAGSPCGIAAACLLLSLHPWLGSLGAAGAN